MRRPQSTLYSFKGHSIDECLIVLFSSVALLLQISCTIIALICTNIAGLFTYWPREKAQRKAFIETRQCIEARLRTQRENQQQVRNEHTHQQVLLAK